MSEWDKLKDSITVPNKPDSTKIWITIGELRRVWTEGDRLQDRHKQTVHQMLRDSTHYQTNITECVKKLEAIEIKLRELMESGHLWSCEADILELLEQ